MIVHNRGGILYLIMQKAAAKRTTSEVDAKKAKRLFFTGLVDISWRLALVILTPILVGSWLDGRQGDGKLFTIIGLLIGIAFAAVVIKNAFIKLNKEVNDL